MFKVIVFKPYGPFIYEKETYEEAISFVKDRWFSPGVWDIRLFNDDQEVKLDFTAWGDRPIYC